MTEQRRPHDETGKKVDPPIEGETSKTERPERPRRRIAQPGMTSWPAR